MKREKGVVSRPNEIASTWPGRHRRVLQRAACRSGEKGKYDGKDETFLVLRSSTEEKGERRGRGEGLSLKRNLLDVEKKRFRNGSDRLYTA